MIGMRQAGCGLAALLLAGAALAQPARLQDRRALVAPGTETTADPQRIPVRPVASKGRELVIRGGRVFDAKSATIKAATVVVQGQRIKAVLPPDSQAWEADAQVIEAAGKTVMPGLIDMHVHITYHFQATPIDRQASEGDGVLRGQQNLRHYLESGFTAVRDLNGVLKAPYLLAEWSAANRIPAPRVFTAGHIITGTGGHATERPITPSHGPDFAQEVDGPDAWRAAVRRTFKEGASVIKIASHFSQAEVEAAIDEAHLLGLKVTCDCESVYTEMAVKAGIDMIEHPLPRTDATIAAMAKQGVAAVPTLQVYQNVLDRNGGFYGSPSRRFTMTSQGNFDVFRKMKAAGVTMGIGTDTIGDAHRLIPNLYIAEMKWFVKGGYSLAQVLQVATLGNARLLDMDDKIGSLEPGKLADIIIVDGRPDEDLDALRRVETVVKDGLLMVESGRVVVPPHVPMAMPYPAPPADTK